MKTKCLIVDDEPLAIKVIESHISKIPNLEIISTCSNAVEAFDVILTNQIDLVFLDVQMPEITGIDLLKSLKNTPAIIFTTAYRDFALEAYELDALDYLLKPIAFERFFKSISKYY
jgi:two-component system LytT family response regulator